MRPKITIVTVTYNSEKTLERTIQSVLTQGYEALEYIIVDGGSTDGTLAIIRRYEADITRWISEPDKGIADAFNKGIGMATGDVIGLINSDDGLLPGALEALAAAYEPQTDVYRGDLELRKEDANTVTVEKPSMYIRYDGLSHIDHPSTFIARRAYETFGVYDTNCRFVMDLDLLLRYQRQGAVFQYVEKPLAFFTMGGLTDTPFTAGRRREMVYTLRKNGANVWQIMAFFAIKYTKMAIIRLVGKDKIMRLTRKRQE